ncbi:MAG: hypothetical protein P8101_10790 [Candidatus Thiodiazotropha sp.]
MDPVTHILFGNACVLGTTRRPRRMSRQQARRIPGRAYTYFGEDAGRREIVKAAWELPRFAPSACAPIASQGLNSGDSKEGEFRCIADHWRCYCP